MSYYDEEQPGIVNEFANKIKQVSAYELNKMVDRLLPGLDKESEAELSQQIKEKTIKVGKVIKALAGDPEVQKVIEDSGEAFTKLTQEIISATGNSIEDLGQLTTDVVSEIISVAGRTITRTVVDVLMSVVGEIPIAGGIVELLASAGIAFNGVANIIRVSTGNIFDILEISDDIASNILTPIKDNLDDFNKLGERALSAYERVEQKLGLLENTYSEQSRQSGLEDGRLEQPVSNVGDERLDQPPRTRRENVDNRLDQKVQQPVVQQPVVQQPVVQQPVVQQPVVQQPVVQQPVSLNLVSGQNVSMDKPEFQTLSREDLNMFRKNQGQEEEESEALRNHQQMRRERVSTPQPISSPPPPPPGRAPDLRPPTSELPKKLKTRNGPSSRSSSPPPPPPGRAPDLRPPTSELPKKLKTRNGPSSRSSSPPPPPPGRAPDLRPPTSELPKKLKTRPREVPVSKPKQKTKKNPPKMNYARPAPQFSK